MFFYLCKVLFSGFLQLNSNFFDAQNNSKYRDWASIKVCERGSIWKGCLIRPNHQKVCQRASVLTSCGRLTLWNYHQITPNLSQAGEERLVGREKFPKSQYGSVRLKISNWRKISAFKANKPFANKTLKVGRKICVLQSKPMGWKLFSGDARVTLCTKDKSVILRMVSKMHVSDKVSELGSMNRVPWYRPGCPSRNKVVKLSGCAILNLTTGNPNTLSELKLNAQLFTWVLVSFLVV